ncbi:MAG: CPBP family intramembrane glutamic endopeptidase [Bacillota bacterium]|nr:CPBP family intramembrane glutamic endopeptidase [Bacillota bacterium]
MFFVETLLQPTYLYKSLIKILTFLSCVFVYYSYHKETSIANILSVKSKKQLLFSLLLGAGVYVTIIGIYVISKSLIDLDNISLSLMGKENVSKDNFLYVSLYISIINSFLEELFFRGFAFIELKKYCGIVFAWVFSATVFAIYHIAIMSSWFSTGLFMVIFISLILAGGLFNYLDKNNTILNSWLVHMGANLGINTIGFIMFELI